MDTRPKVSVVINNYNYGRFIGEAIDSVLAQHEPCHELVVVDDGSTDHSRQVIEAYGDRLIAVFKENGGQASALNVGYGRTSGDVVIFLDADDVLLPNAVSAIASTFAGAALAKVHWPVEIVSVDGERTGCFRPQQPLPHGDLREVMRRQGPASVVSPPMSGNAFAREFLDRVMPIPEQPFRIGADAYLYGLAPFLGSIGRLDNPVSLYRQHGTNHYSAIPVALRIDCDAAIESAMFEAVRRELAKAGEHNWTSTWGTPWPVGQQAVLQMIEQTLRGASTFVLVDEEQWGADSTIGRRRRLPFLEKQGEYWGVPANDEQAVSEIERLRRGGAEAIVFVASTLWWLDCYPGFARHLEDSYRCVADTADVKIFDLRHPRL